VAIDRLMKGFGMPMGPFELLDEIGTDVAEKVGKVLHEGLGVRATPAPLAGKLHAAGRLGRKAARGVYIYNRKSARGRKPDPDFWRSLRTAGTRPAATGDNAIFDRVFGRMIDEASWKASSEVLGNSISRSFTALDSHLSVVVC
jgi:3-hydroxyacyl-CoA dehydrogenase/enoyl-CoA hydratase/3-hydroxybutyryl-CoA epimerase